MLPRKQQNKKEGRAEPAPTSWGKVASWYDEYLGSEDSYQKQVILPNILRIVAPKRGMRLLDLACGQGFFSEAFANAGAEVTGVDISLELIKKARARLPNVTFAVAPADNVRDLKSSSFHHIVCVLAIQNIAELDQTFKEAKRLLAPGGRFVFVLNHPAFRIPRSSDWFFDESTKSQGRMITKYMSESSVKIDLHPFARNEQKNVFTLSFHRPLQTYMKTLFKNGFAMTRLEEWISHKKSTPGPRSAAEDSARKEIPMFMCIECISLSK